MKTHNYYKETLTILCNIPDTRNDDRFLTVCLWKNYNAHQIGKIDLQDGVTLKDIVYSLPHSDSIERARRLIQNTLRLYPPTKWSVAKHRRMKEEEWRENMSWKGTLKDAEQMLEIYLKNK